MIILATRLSLLLAAECGVCAVLCPLRVSHRFGESLNKSNLVLKCWVTYRRYCTPSLRAHRGQSLLSVDLDFGAALRAYRTFITWAIVFLAISGTVASAAGKATGIKTNGRSFFGRPRMLERKPIGLEYE